MEFDKEIEINMNEIIKFKVNILCKDNKYYIKQINVYLVNGNRKLYTNDIRRFIGTDIFNNINELNKLIIEKEFSNQEIFEHILNKISYTFKNISVSNIKLLIDYIILETDLNEI